MVKHVLLTSLLITATTASFAQTLHYDVVKGSKKVGDLTVQKITVDSTTVKYTIESDVSLKILFTFNVKFTSEEVFKNGRLVDGDAVSSLNGRTQKDSHITSSSPGVIVRLNGSDYDQHHKAIVYSVPMLYFEEPLDRTEIFSQQFANYITLKRSEEKYILDSPDGYNYYTYKDGICQEVKVTRDFATFYFRLKEVK